MWLDLSPLRPDEYGEADAERWTDCVQKRNAALEGIAAAHAEAAGERRLASFDLEKVS